MPIDMENRNMKTVWIDKHTHSALKSMAAIRCMPLEDFAGLAIQKGMEFLEHQAKSDTKKAAKRFK